MLLFGEPVERQEMDGKTIPVGDVMFRITPAKGGLGDRWRIVAHPRQGEFRGDPADYSTILYSPREGVLSMSFPAFIGDEVYRVNYVPCGRRKLKYEDVRRFVEANR